jgi:hypothetical protein
MQRFLAVVLLGTLASIDVASAAGFSFGRPIRLVTERNVVGSVAVGDANGDGRKDLAYTRDVAFQTVELVLHLQRTDGSFAAPIRMPLPGNRSMKTAPISFVDTNKDGKQELFVGMEGTANVLARLNGTTLTGVDVPTTAGCEYIALGDIEGDGNLDVVCHNWQNILTVHFGDGVGGFRGTLEYETPAGNWYQNNLKSLVIADVTGDGRPDVTVSASSINSFFVLENNGLGGFWPGAIAYPHHAWSNEGVFPAGLAVLDIDGDDVNEVVTATPGIGPDSMLNIYRRTTAGYLAFAERFPIRDSTTALQSSDIDGDGDDELLAGHFEFHDVTVFGADTTGILAQARYELPGFGETIESILNRRIVGSSHALALGDLDGDGCTDLAAATYAGVTLLFGCEPARRKLPISDFDGDGMSDLLWRYDALSVNALWRWADHDSWYGDCPIVDCPTLIPPPWKHQAFGDFDGDGSSDTFIRHPQTGENRVLLAAWYIRSIATVTNQQWQVVGTGDFDRDDRSDLVWRNSATGANTIWRAADINAQRTMTTVIDRAWKIAGIGDFDGDGFSDVLWRHAGNGRNAIWRTGNNATQLAIATVNNLAWKVAGIGDFDGDGRDDIVWRNASSGANAIWRSGDSMTQLPVAAVNNFDWTIGAIGDYDGDGRADLMWRNTRTGANTIWRRGNNATQQAVKSFDPVFKLLPLPSQQ